MAATDHQGSVDSNARLLSSLAILSVDASQQKSYLDHFVPFAVNALVALNSASTLHEITVAIQKEFELEIPDIVAKEILKRAERQRFVILNGNEYAISERGTSLSSRFIKTRNDILSDQGIFHEDLVEYVKRLHGIEWTLLDANQAVESFMLQLSLKSTIDVLSRNVNEESFKSLEDDVAGKFLVAQFILDCYKSNQDSESVRTLENMVKGSMLASALYLPVPPEFTLKFKDTTLWLDTPIALKLLGLEGEQEREFYGSAIEMALSQGADLGVFEHSLSEMHSIIYNATRGQAGSVPHNTSPVSRFFMSAGISIAEIVQIDHNLEKNLAEMKIRIERKPETLSENSVDEDDLEARIQAIIPYANYGSLQKDVDSLTSIYRLRRERHTKRVEECKALFITDNFPLIEVSHEFFEIAPGDVSIAMTLERLAWILWIKNPIAEPNLPRERIHADAMALLEPSVDLWSVYLRELALLAKNNYVTPETLAIFRSEEIMGNFLMEQTLGDPKNLTRDSLKVMLAKFTNGLTEKTRSELETKLKDQAEQYEAELASRPNNAGQELVNQAKRELIISSSKTWADRWATCVLFLVYLPIALEVFEVFNLFVFKIELNVKLNTGIKILIGIFVMFQLSLGFWQKKNDISFAQLHPKFSKIFQNSLQKRKFSQYGLY